MWNRLKAILADFIQQADLVLLGLCCAATLYGMALIASATRYLGTGGILRYVGVQGAAMVLGICAYIFMSMLDLERLMRRWKWLVAFNVVFIALLLTPFGVSDNTGNTAWLKFPFLPFSIGPAEVVKITKDGWETLLPAEKEMRVCAFLWTYYGYPNSNYEGINVEVMRYRNGEIMARDEVARGQLPKVDYVAGVPDSGVPHAIGFANRSGKPFARPFVKYTPTWPRSFMPTSQEARNQVAKMKQIPVPELIEGKKLLFVDDSIVRGTQLRETVEFLYESGAEEVHMRSACPPVMYGCKYLNFSRSNSDMELLARRTIQELEGDEGQQHIEEYADASTERGRCMLRAICEKLGFDSLGYQSLDGLLEAIGLDRFSQVLLFSTEGNTDPMKFRKVLWDGEYPTV